MLKLACMRLIFFLWYLDFINSTKYCMLFVTSKAAFWGSVLILGDYSTRLQGINGGRHVLNSAWSPSGICWLLYLWHQQVLVAFVWKTISCFLGEFFRKIRKISFFDNLNKEQRASYCLVKLLNAQSDCLSNSICTAKSITSPAKGTNFIHHNN